MRILLLILLAFLSVAVADDHIKLDLGTITNGAGLSNFQGAGSEAPHWMSPDALASTDGSSGESTTTEGTLYFFEDREELTESNLWARLVEDRDNRLAAQAVIHLNDTGTYLRFQPKKASLGWWRKRLDVHLVEFSPGKDVYTVGSDFYPVLTASAQLCSGPVTVERMVSRSLSSTFSVNLNRAIGEALQSFRTVFALNRVTTETKKQYVICTAPTGGRVQLQVSSRMLHYPSARTREVRWDASSGQFTDDEWEDLVSDVEGERYSGALFDDRESLGKFRCVTDTDKFEDVTLRKWVEYSIPHGII